MNPVHILSLLIVATMVLIAGCGGPSMVDRDNRRVVDEILTAITIKNLRLLDAGQARAKARHAAAQFTDDEYQAIEAIIARGRAGDWQGAENDGYAFRKQHPFVKEGQ